MPTTPNTASVKVHVSASSAKRKKAEDLDDVRDEPSEREFKKQRTRVSFSCGECHRRKQKCDRQVPCSHCIARKVPELCRAYTPGKPEQDYGARIARLEQIIETALPRYVNMVYPSMGNVALSPSAPNASLPTPDTPGASTAPYGTYSNGGSDNVSPPLDDEDQVPSGGAFHRGRWYGDSVSSSVAPGCVLEQLQYNTRLDNVQLPNHNGSKVEGPEPTIPDALEAERLQVFVQEYSLSPDKVYELLKELPSQEQTERLIQWYFDVVNWTRYPISRRDFMAAYHHVRESLNGPANAAFNSWTVRFMPLLFVVLAIASRLATEDVGGDKRKRHANSVRYYWTSRRSLLLAVSVQPDGLDIVLTRLLSARFLTFDRRITECWSQLGAAVRTAQALGLHRDGSELPLGVNPDLVEYRRRIWSYLYHADRSYALVLGRPNSIQDDYTSTLPPSNVDDDRQRLGQPVVLDLSQPTPMTFVILRHKLAGIMGHIVHHFQNVKPPPSYKQVITLDNELMTFTRELPVHFSITPDTSQDKTLGYIPIHRFLLVTEILFVRTSLHRPYLLRRLKSDRYEFSRKACFESAIMDFDVRSAFRRNAEKETRDSLSNAYREFQTAMISGIYLVLYPEGPYCSKMHEILDSFIAEHEGMEDVDDTTRRELTTIEFLKNKSQSQSKTLSAAMAGPSTVLSTSASPSALELFTEPDAAHLLLGLQQSGSSSRTSLTSLAAITTTNMPAAVPISTSQTTSPNHNHSSPMEAVPRPPATHYPQSPHLYTHSPTMQRLATTETCGGTGNISSPSNAGGSPSGDDADNSAQDLLDRWCNQISTAPALTADIDGWNLGPGGDTTFDYIDPNWSVGLGNTSVGGGNDSAQPALETSDLMYWETLVDHLRK